MLLVVGAIVEADAARRAPTFSQVAVRVSYP